MNEIEKLWRAFLEKPFPEDCIGLQPDGLDLVSLDTFTAGCIETFIADDGRLDEKQAAILKDSVQKLERIDGHLDGDAKIYFEELRSLAEQVLKSVQTGF